MTWRRLVVTVGTIALVAWITSHVADWIAVDDCLDGGGRWNYDHEACEGTE
jgi:hypothetical protein